MIFEYLNKRDSFSIYLCQFRMMYSMSYSVDAIIPPPRLAPLHVLGPSGMRLAKPITSINMFI
jgi:hypothetical protein